MLLHALTLALAPVLPLLQEGKPRDPRTPPGLVWIEGGPTKIGSTEKEVGALAELDELLFVPTACETPQHEVRVEGFYLGVSEVTNEQYRAFVKATGRRAPESWAAKAIDAAQAEHAGSAPGESFDRSAWWRANGAQHTQEGQGWELPLGSETLPVVGVDYEDAEAYARWAGVRLMSEVEYQRAGRGKEARAYPWGDAFDPDRALTNAARATAAHAVGSSPTGATSEGVHDLCGNVWEWTSSPFAPYPRWKVLELELGKARGGRVLQGAVAWDETARVAVGGSFQNDAIAARLTTRRGTERALATDSLGLRVAASAAPGRDKAAAILASEIPAELRPEGVEYDVAKLTATDRWRSQPGSAKLAGYGVIEAYDHALFVPVVDLPVSSASELDAMARERGPVAVGILSLSLDAVEPALPRGTYFVAYLPKQAASGAGAQNGTPQKQGRSAQDAKAGSALRGELGLALDGVSSQAQDAPAAGEGSDEAPAGLDRSLNHLVFYSLADEAVAALPIGELELGRPKEPRATLGAGTLASSGKDGAQVACDRLTLSVTTWVKSSGKGFGFEIPLDFAQGTLGEGWRR